MWHQPLAERLACPLDSEPMDAESHQYIPGDMNDISADDATLPLHNSPPTSPKLKSRVASCEKKNCPGLSACTSEPAVASFAEVASLKRSRRSERPRRALSACWLRAFTSVRRAS